MIYLHEKSTNNLLGTINDTQLQFLLDQLEEEGLADQDYAVTPLLLDMFESEGADPELVALLRNGLGDREEIEILWRR
jgi:hypothetical protein